jgi:hypothetical protein
VKFTLNIADDQRPEGWHEDHSFNTRDLAKAEELAQAMVADFNLGLRTGEVSRRLLKIEVAHPRKRFCKLEFVVDKITYRAELRADGLHVRRKGSPKFRVLAMRDALQVLNGQGLLKLD